jgi:putative oxygen-independent coproporphyrinogen III oxidase
MSDDWRAGGFGLYLHWPFCAAKCPYCDFNSHVVARVDHARWLTAFQHEIKRLAAQTPGRILNTVFLGGGTPSLMPADLVAGVLEAVRAAWPQANDVEVTLEANPTSAEAGRFRAYAQAGVNRVSIGVQALDDGDLKRLGRMHSVAEALATVEMARETFARVSFDLIYARQDQTPAAWEAELTRALALGPDHLSLYQLTVEPGTAFGDRHARGGLKGLPDEDAAAEMFHLTQELCALAGLPAYEVSNHAVEGGEARHNLVYWRSGDWGGIGPGAHGRLTLGGTRWATETPRAPEGWLRQVETQGQGEAARVAVPLAEQAEEMLMMGLRLAEGIDLARYERLAGQPLDPDTVSRLTDLGVVTQAGGRLAATAQGRAVLNGVLRELL